MAGKPGHFGEFGGQYVPETLMTPLEELTAAYDGYKNDAAFRDELAAEFAKMPGFSSH